VIAKADAENGVGETNETNNTTARGIQLGPDLTVSVLTVPSTASAGSTVSVTDTTKNQGGGMAGASTTQFYLSTNSTLDAGDTFLGSRPVGSLAAGAVLSGSTSLTLPSGLATGLHYVIAKADAENGVGETNETNNTTARGITINQ
jgi:subtilase family serine protease